MSFILTLQDKLSPLRSTAIETIGDGKHTGWRFLHKSATILYFGDVQNKVGFNIEFEDSSTLSLYRLTLINNQNRPDLLQMFYARCILVGLPVDGFTQTTLKENMLFLRQFPGESFYLFLVCLHVVYEVPLDVVDLLVEVFHAWNPRLCPSLNNRPVIQSAPLDMVDVVINFQLMNKVLLEASKGYLYLDMPQIITYYWKHRKQELSSKRILEILVAFVPLSHPSYKTLTTLLETEVNSYTGRAIETPEPMAWLNKPILNTKTVPLFNAMKPQLDLFKILIAQMLDLQVPDAPPLLLSGMKSSTSKQQQTVEEKSTKVDQATLKRQLRLAADVCCNSVYGYTGSYPAIDLVDSLKEICGDSSDDEKRDHTPPDTKLQVHEVENMLQRVKPILQSLNLSGIEVIHCLRSSEETLESLQQRHIEISEEDLARALELFKKGFLVLFVCVGHISKDDRHEMVAALARSNIPCPFEIILVDSWVHATGH